MSTWVDLGDGRAIRPEYVTDLFVDGPWPPSRSQYRPFLEQETWTVSVRDDDWVVHTVGYFWDEAGARRLARSIVGAMLDAAA